MAVRQRMADDERDNLTKDVDDLDAVYLEKMKEQGVDMDILEQLAAMMAKDNEGRNVR